jgi:hypothetical protein
VSMNSDAGYCYSFLDSLVAVLGGSEAVGVGLVTVEKIPVYYPDYIAFYVVIRFEGDSIEVACLDSARAEVRVFRGVPGAVPDDRFFLDSWYSMNRFQQFLSRFLDVIVYTKKIKKHISASRR